MASSLAAWCMLSNRVLVVAVVFVIVVFYLFLCGFATQKLLVFYIYLKYNILSGYNTVEVTWLRALLSSQRIFLFLDQK